MIFNIVVDVVVRVVLEQVCSPQESQHGMGLAVGERKKIMRMTEGWRDRIISGCSTL